MIKRLKRRLRFFFGFTSREARGLLALFTLIVLFFTAPYAVRLYLLSEKPRSAAEDEKILRAWYEEVKSKIKAKEELEAPKQIRAYHFNPNVASKEDFIRLGFRKYVAQRIIKYRSKGGRFRTKEDLMKIYGINQALVKSYAEYLIFPPPPSRPPAPKFPRKPKKETRPDRVEKKIKYDLNLADTLQLRKVRGIGRVLSQRIIKYRDALGGFFSPEQLLEVYGIKPEVYKRLLTAFQVAAPSVKKVNINQAAVRDLARHPYISYNVGRAIVKYRAQHGSFRSVDDLNKIYIITDSIYARLLPYVKAAEQEDSTALKPKTPTSVE